MIDGDPLEGRLQIDFYTLHELPRELPQILDLVGVFGGNNEAELVPVTPAARL